MDTQLSCSVSDDERRTRYAASIRRLGDFFPQGCESRIKQHYFERLLAGKRHPDDVDDAVDRVIDTRKQKSFPPWSDIADRLIDIAKDQRGFQPTDLDREPRFDTSEEGVAASLAVLRAGRAADMPEPEPDIKTDRDHRRKLLGITPLTQAEIDSIQRKKRDRECARHAEASSDPLDAEDADVSF